MAWGRLDDGLYDHPKVMELPRRQRNGCMGLWARAVSWSNRHLTDGRVPSGQLAALDAAPSDVDALITVGLFDRVPGGIVIHDFLDFSHSRDDVLARRAADRVRKESARKPNGHDAESVKSPQSFQPSRARPGPVPVPGTEDSLLEAERDSQGRSARAPVAGDRKLPYSVEKSR